MYDRETLERIEMRLLMHGVSLVELVGKGRRGLMRWLRKVYKSEGESWSKRNYLELADAIIKHFQKEVDPESGDS